MTSAPARFPLVGFLAFFLLVPGIALWPGPENKETGAGEGEGEGPSLRADVAAESQGRVSSILRIEGDFGFSVLGLAIDGDGAVLRGAIAYGPVTCGPGRLSGPAGFFSSPLSLSATSLGGASFRADAGLGSGLSLLSLDLGPVMAFALCRNGSKGFIAAAPGLAAGEEKPAAAGFSLVPPPIAGESGCAVGLSGHLKAARGNLAFLASASRSGPPDPGSGWLLEAKPDPGGLGLVVGLAYEARSQDWRSAFGVEYSWGPLRGGGCAARLEGSAQLPPLRLSLSAGYAAAGFRDCLGEDEARGAVLALDCGLPLWSGASFRASFRIKCPAFDAVLPRGITLCDLIERSASLALSARLGGNKAGSGSLRLKSVVSFGLDVDGAAYLAPDFGLSGGTGATAWRLGLSGRWVERPGEAAVGPEMEAIFKVATPSSAPLSLVASYCVSWEQGDGPPALETSLGLSAAAFGGGRISAVAEWGKFGLGPAGPDDDLPTPAITFRYSVSK